VNIALGRCHFGEDQVRTLDASAAFALTAAMFSASFQSAFSLLVQIKPGTPPARNISNVMEMLRAQKVARIIVQVYLVAAPLPEAASTTAFDRLRG